MRSTEDRGRRNHLDAADRRTAPHDGTGPASATAGSGLRVWPLDPPAGRAVLVAYVAMFAALLAIGMLLVHVLHGTELVGFDERAARWFEARRTPARNDLAQLGSALADAYTLTPAVIVLSAAFVAIFRRWHDTVMLGGSLLLEKGLFLPVTLLVGRDRPPVQQLDGAPPTSSFPSGHVAAAVAAYVGLAVVVRWHVRNRAVRAAFDVVAVAAPLAVLVSRLALGMHHVTDVVVGACSGAACVVIVHTALLATSRRAVMRAEGPVHARRLDLTAPQTIGAGS